MKSGFTGKSEFILDSLDEEWILGEMRDVNEKYTVYSIQYTF